MKKLLGALLALAMLCVFGSLVGAADDLGLTEMELGSPITVTVGAQAGAHLAFYPAQSGWYTLEGTATFEEVYVSFNVSLHENSLVSAVRGPLMDHPGTLLLNNSGTPVAAAGNDRKSGMRSLYLQAGKSYEVEVRCAAIVFGSAFGAGDTPTVVVRKAESITGRGTVNANNVVIDNGAPVRMDELFTTSPPYSLMRVSVLGDAVGADLIAKKAGASTLVFYDMAGNEVGRSTVTVRQWWESIHPILQSLLRWFAFGWIWMR